MTPTPKTRLSDRIRNLKLEAAAGPSWSLRSAIDILAGEVEQLEVLAALPPNAGANIAAKAGVHAALANLARAEKAEAALVASERARQRAEHEGRTFMGYLADRQGLGKDCATSYMIERLARVLAALAPDAPKDHLGLLEET